jgi:uncharacterized protein YcgL (UPF0745 family)
MLCYVYASLRKADTYLWLARRDDFGAIPASLTEMLGKLRFALELELHSERRLPLEDARTVLAHLESQGWHLQLPPAQTLAAANHLAYNAAPRDGQEEQGDGD